MTSSRWTLVAAVLASACVFLDTSVVNVALPQIGRQLPVHLFGVLEAQSYIYSAYLVTLSSLLILGGALNDFYGRRRMFATGLVGFGICSALCGLAPTMELLIVFRILQGATAALLVPGSLAIITATFQGAERGQAIGVWAAASSATSIVGPFVGGVLVDTVSWRAAFLINVPLLMPAVYAVLRHVPESRDEEASGAFDWLGSAVIVAASAGLSFGAIYGQQREWREPLAYVLLAVGGLAAVAFPFLMARRKNPLVPLSLFRVREFAVANLSTFLIYGALYVQFYYMVLFLQGTLGYSAAATGLVGLPGTLFLVFFSSRFGRMAARYGFRLFMTAGPLLMGVATLWLIRIPAGSTPWRLAPADPGSWLPPLSYLVDVLPYTLVFGLGIAMLVTPLTTVVMNSVPMHRAGLASAINNAVSRIGPPLAAALVFIAINATFYAVLAVRMPGVDTSSPAVRSTVTPLNAPGPRTPPDMARAARTASADAFHVSAAAVAAMLLAGAAVNGFGIRPDKSSRRREQESRAGSRAEPADMPT